ncbi:MAG TPA: exodeoxyribonuclease V subunit gamma [Solirubrobacteraceae bacterium]|nr:exodeoxyribonuclease V subunit gamma [Solirubrobacteraceae bacterium]
MLHIHRAERADGLVSALGDLLAVPLGDPFAAEVVAVPTRGMERWLTQRLSSGLGAQPGRADGICARVEFPTPRRLVGDAVAAMSGIDPDADPWLPERAVWPLLEIVDEARGEPWLRALGEHLGGSDGDRAARRYAAMRHLADLFDRYALHRPELVRAWARGDDGGIADDAAWQAELWRRLRDRIPVPGPAERIEGACGRLREQPGLVDLPARIALFGLTRLPAGHLAVLDALAAHRDVHLLVLHPSPALWEQVAGHDVTRRETDPTKSIARNGLLASWGHDVRELQLVLEHASAHRDHHHPVAATGRDTLLSRLQAAVREDRPAPAPDRRPALDPADRTVQVHACHGRARQVEVLRDAILHLLEDDPTLEPRDVIVMCPDIESFAPLIQATFGAGEIAPDDDEVEALPPELRPPDLRVRLADRSLRQTNPLLGVVARLIELADERLTASQVVDLADREPVRRRFGLDDDDLARLEQWVRASGIRWGLDAPHRAPFKLDAVPTGTWRFGLDRLLLGVTMTEDEQRLVAGVLPLDDVDSGAIDLAGRVAELVDRLQASLDRLAGAQPVDAWAQAIGDAADALAATTPRDAWQRAELQRLLDDVVAEAAGHDVALTLAELRALLGDRLRGRPTRANFRTGHLTICTLVPMRSVPHRVVCQLGLDDGVFPRKAPRDGDDLMLADQHVGERDARTEDRQQLLDALMAATDRLLITYEGNDERTNLPRPPAVPVGELLDTIERTVTGADVVVRHPLQPFDARNFEPGALVPGEVWSFDRTALRGAQALADERPAARAFLAAPLPPLDSPLIELDDLVRFVERPVRAFLRQRLGVSVADYSDELDDAMAVELDGLERWQVGDRLLRARLAGAGEREAALAEIARGTLPPGVLGRPAIDGVWPAVTEIMGHVPEGETRSLDVKLTLRDGRVLSGTVPGLVGDVLRTVVYSRVSARHRIAAWVRLLALTAAHPERPFEALTVGRAPSGSDALVTVARIPLLDADPAARRELALDHLEVLADLRDRGLREPPPLACLASAAYARAARGGRDPLAAAKREWESAWSFPREDAEPEHVLAFDGVRTIEELLDAPARADEQGAFWDPAEPRRFGRWARRLWDGLLGVEEVQER